MNRTEQSLSLRCSGQRRVGLYIWPKQSRALYQTAQGWTIYMTKTEQSTVADSAELDYTYDQNRAENCTWQRRVGLYIWPKQSRALYQTAQGWTLYMTKTEHAERCTGQRPTHLQIFHCVTFSKLCKGFANGKGLHREIICFLQWTQRCPGQLGDI